ncbi:MAG TPA: class I SAM-dependent methyltransferase [Euzebyales bacterium]|nr:class I SAM-dependent methyltransferase [Euzebyales bacterium]
MPDHEALPDHRPVTDKDAALVQRMFDRVAPRYDLANAVLSAGFDRHWRDVTVAAIDPRPGMVVLDVAGGTGALAAPLAARGAHVVVADLSPEMVRVGRGRVAGVGWTVADALRLPFADASVDAATIAFGLRNLNDTRAGLAELRRIVRPGGQLAVLEFSRPTNRAFAHVYHRYLLGVLPRLAQVLTSDPGAYGYLARSIMAWPDQRALAAAITDAGWGAVRWKNLTGGVVALHHAVRPA